MSAKRQNTVAEKLRMKANDLTAAERKLMAALFADYPVAGLASITEFAKLANVSTPSVLRLAKKLGFSGFPALQEALRGELSAQLQNPIAKHERWAAEAPDAHILNRFADAAMDNLRASLRLMDHRVFDEVARLLGARRRAIHIMGGRITGAIAHYLYTHLHMARPNVHLVPEAQALWPQYLMNLSRGDVLLAFDVRRYDARMLDFAVSAQAEGAEIVLITDQWMSPIARIASLSLPVRIEVPSSWDSNMVPLFVAEALVAAVVNHNWPDTQSRIHRLETFNVTLRRGKS